MNEFIDWINAEGAGHYFFIAFPICLLILFILLKGKRTRFLIPSLLMTLIIVNPWFYQKWTDLGLYAYWRILWVVPVVPIIAVVVPKIAEATDKVWIKSIVVAIGMILTCFGGSYIYNGAGGSFALPSNNTAKLPEEVVEVADYLLTLDDQPKAVVQYPLGVYLRQYTGDIDILYGRDLDGYILWAGSVARNVHNQLSAPDGDLIAVATTMANDSYDYLVVNSGMRDSVLSDKEYEFVGDVSEYDVYRVHGSPNVLKERDESGLVTSVTTLDEAGQPSNGDAGYATVSYEYDDNGLIIREFRTDVDGVGVADSNGRAGYEREYDQAAHLVMERYIDAEGKPIANTVGYAEYRREYKGSDLVKEYYLDEQGQLVDRVDTLYAMISMGYDQNHNRIEERYYNAEGNITASSAGYAMVKRKFNGKHMVQESYFDEGKSATSVVAGYSSINWDYDADGRVASISYFDTEGDPTESINSYAKEEREYDAAGNMTLQRFLKADGTMVRTAAGYAEVHRTYEDKHLVHEAYYGIDGEPYSQAAGYYAIDQDWDGDNLISRTYLDENGNPTIRTDGYSKAVWIKDEGNGSETWNLHLKDVDGNEVSLDGKNLARDIKTAEDGWSEWMTPSPNTVNSFFNIGNTNLGPKEEGDTYCCSIEIEFKNVAATAGHELRFWAQGAQDGRWFTGNVWNSNIVYMMEAPEDGVYSYTATNIVSGDMINISNFNVGFRCDYWASGSFRVRNVKIEKGDAVTTWTPGV